MRKKIYFFQKIKAYVKGVQFSILFSFFILASIIAGSIIFHNYTQYTEKMSEFADGQVEAIAKETLHDITGFLKPIEDVTKVSKWLIQNPAQLKEQRQTIITQIIGIFETLPQISGFTIALENGDVLTVNHISTGSYIFQSDHTLPENVKFRVQIIDRQDKIAYETYEYYNELAQKITSEERSLPIDHTIIEKSSPSTPLLYEPRKRPWYKAAKKARQATWVDIYSSIYEGEQLLTTSNPIFDPSGQFLGVVAASVYVKEFSKFLKSQVQGFVASAFLFDRKGGVVAYSENAEKEENITRVKNIQHLNIHKAYETYAKNPTKRIVYSADSDDLDDVAYFFPFPDNIKGFWTLGMVIIGKNFLGIVHEIRANTIYFSLILLVLSVLLMIFISRRIAKPIQVVAKALKNLHHLKLDPIPPIKSRLSDIQEMIEGLNGLASGLRSFGKFIPKSLSLQFLKQKEEVRVGGEDKEITILFTDIQDFTSISEKLPRAQLAFYLSDYFEEMTRVIQENKGTVDKYIGDAIMAFWGAPLPNADHAYSTCKAALLCQRKLVTLNKKWAEDKKPVLKTRFGIGTGVAHVGNTGSSDRLQYTALGDCVNLSARLEGMNKVYGTGILISEKTYQTISKRFITRPVDLIAVKGQEKGGQIYELLEERFEDESLNHAQLIDLAYKTEQAYELYHARHWKKALGAYYDLQRVFPEDKLAGVFIKRCENFIETPPDPSWDGVFRMNMHV